MGSISYGKRSVERGSLTYFLVCYNKLNFKNMNETRQKKSRLYGSLQTLKTEVQEAEAFKKCVEQAVQPEQTRAKTQSKRRDMEL